MLFAWLKVALALALIFRNHTNSTHSTHSQSKPERKANKTNKTNTNVAAVNTNCWVGAYPASASHSLTASINTTQPHDGEWIGLTFVLDLARPIDSGTIRYSSVINGFVPYDFNEDLCASLEKGSPSLTCPLGARRLESTGAVQATGIASLKLKDEWIAADGTQIACATLTVTL